MKKDRERAKERESERASVRDRGKKTERKGEED